MNLFQLGKFKLNSGQESDWKIECDNLVSKDWMALAKIASELLPPFREVEGIPRGGLAFAEALRAYRSGDAIYTLLCDDVLTTGGSMERMRNHRKNVIGVVAFSRNHEPPKWILPLFCLSRPFTWEGYF